jgi:hypothetical protein
MGLISKQKGVESLAMRVLTKLLGSNIGTFQTSTRYDFQLC